MASHSPVAFNGVMAFTFDDFALNRIANEVATRNFLVLCSRWAAYTPVAPYWKACGSVDFRDKNATNVFFLNRLTAYTKRERNKTDETTTL